MDAGLKQWIINGIAMAVSFIPIVGPLLSCVIDGTIVDVRSVKSIAGSFLFSFENPE